MHRSTGTTLSLWRQLILKRMKQVSGGLFSTAPCYGGCSNYSYAWKLIMVLVKIHVHIIYTCIHLSNTVIQGHWQFALEATVDQLKFFFFKSIA